MKTLRWSLLWTVPAVVPALMAQPAGFDPVLARDLSALCTTHTFRDLYGSDEAIMPAGYERLHTSAPRGMDNLFQVFRKGPLGVIELRGSTADPLSWMENVHAAMLPARGTILLDGRPFDYHFADDTAAAVHAGYTLGVAFVVDEVLEQLLLLDRQGVHDIVITGHSQGGALAQLVRAHLEHLPVDQVPVRARFRTYAFANPMVGNAAFAREYDRAYCSSGTSFSIINPEDPVPGMPLAYHDHRIFSAATLNGMASGQDGYDMRSLARSALFRMFRGTVTDLAQYVSSSVEKRIARPVGEVKLPPYREEMNYVPMPGRVPLAPFPYPLILRDSTILTNDSLLRANPRDEQGVFLNKELYRRAPGFYQHKPYNYHVAILRRWFPERYGALRVKVLPENL